MSGDGGFMEAADMRALLRQIVDSASEHGCVTVHRGGDWDLRARKLLGMPAEPKLEPDLYTHPERAISTCTEATGEELDVNGMVDEKSGVSFIGKAHKMADGTWRCLANVGGSLCRVQVTPRFRDPATSILVAECPPRGA